MLTHHPLPESVRALRKRLLRTLLPDAQPAARMERMARALGFASDAACTADMAHTPHQPLHERRTLELLESLGRGDPLGLLVEGTCTTLYQQTTSTSWHDDAAVAGNATAGQILAMASGHALRPTPTTAPTLPPVGHAERMAAIRTGLATGGDPWKQAQTLEPALRWFYAFQTALVVFPDTSAVPVPLLQARRLWAYGLMIVPDMLDSVQRYDDFLTISRANRPANDMWERHKTPWLYEAHEGLESIVFHYGSSHTEHRENYESLLGAVRTVGQALAQGKWIDVPQATPKPDLMGLVF